MDERELKTTKINMNSNKNQCKSTLFEQGEQWMSAANEERSKTHNALCERLSHAERRTFTNKRFQSVMLRWVIVRKSKEN
jgi:hypothetical protein